MLKVFKIIWLSLVDGEIEVVIGVMVLKNVMNAVIRILKLKEN